MPTDADPPRPSGHLRSDDRAGPDQLGAIGADPARDGWPGPAGEPAAPSLRERLVGWVRPTPGEVVGLALLVLGSVVATLLWWGQSVTGPADLEEVLAGGAVVAADGSSSSLAPGSSTAGPVEQASGDGAHDGSSGPAGEVTVHLSGAIARPGLVTLATGGRVGDAVLAAGGLTREADPDRVNLARPLVDGEHVHVPRVSEDGVGGMERGGPAGAGGGGIGAAGRAGPIDLNRAGVDELEQLPGIGPARAAAIVEYRERNGPFVVPGDLRGVSGIGEATFQNLAPLVVVR